MDKLPDELVLHIAAFLEPSALCSLALVSTHLLRLSRDSNIWKHLCFAHSATEQRRRRLASSSNANVAIDPHLAELIRAADSLASEFNAGVSNSNAVGAELQEDVDKGKREKALLANWDPSYTSEKVDWYQEFVDRHAEVKVRWFQDAGEETEEEGIGGGCLRREATGAGILFGQDGQAERLVAPVDDGSVKIWDARAGSETQGRCLGGSEIGLLSGKGSDLDMNTRLEQSRSIMTDTGAVECVSIDSMTRKGFFAVQDVLNEVDLNTLQIVSRTPFPFPITALSEAQHSTPLTVGTNWTLHLHDPRKPPSVPSASRCELIGGGTDASFSRLATSDFGDHVSLSQPGALSILHLPSAQTWDNTGDIWVAGRFTSMLNFDRRFFPRLRSTLHSGARLSCITALPHPFVPPHLRTTTSPSLLRDAKATVGYTLIAAGEYKGKGSLELYGLARSSPDTTTTTTTISTSPTSTTAPATYQNRQTASRSKLLSVAPHGTRLAFSDGDGMLKWVERDASTPVRSFNINHLDARGNLLSEDHCARALNSSSSSSSSGERVLVNPLSSPSCARDDIVLKILPMMDGSLMASSSSSLSSLVAPETETETQTQTQTQTQTRHGDLVLWTGDGKLGVVGFGRAPFEEEVWVDAVERQGGVGDVERERERRYEGEMRRALEHQARELRWLRGYGLG